MVVADTHVLLWWVSSPEQLSARARRELDRERAGFSVITCMEVGSLVRRGRIAITAPPDRWFEVVQADPRTMLLPLTQEIALVAASLPDDVLRDPADRIIVATAIVHRVPLVTRDHKIASAGLVPTIW